MKKRLKILFATISTFFSHTTRPLCIAECLQKRGHEVAFLAGHGNKTLIENAGFKVFLVHELPHTTVIASGALPAYVERFLAIDSSRRRQNELGICQMAEEDLHIYSFFKPDVVVNDGRETTHETAYLAGIPSIRIENLMAINPAFEPELSYCVESEIAEEKKQFLEKAKAKKIEYGYTLPPIGRILPGLFEFDTFEGMNYHQFTPHQVVGPLYWSGWKQNRKPDRNKYMDAKVILVTIGSSYPFPHIVKCVIDSFGGKKGYWVIINSGGQVGKEYTDYPNVEDAPFIALDDYLAISHAVVFHGGHGTVLRLIKAGVPGVAIPFNGSQMIVSRQFEKLGLGIRIKKYPDDVTVVELHTALMSVLHDPSFRERMAPYRNLLEQRSNGEEEASDFIEQYTHNANLKRLSYALMSLRSGQI